MVLRVRFVIAVAASFFLSTINGDEAPNFMRGIFDGWAAKPRQFPYPALIGCVYPKDTLQWICNGEIINHRFVMTANICVKNTWTECNNFIIRVDTNVHSALSTYINTLKKRPRTIE